MKQMQKGTLLVCSTCSRSFSPRLDGTCECGGLLLARYPAPVDLRPKEGGLWSWASLLPDTQAVRDENQTPLIEFGGAWIKDDGVLPTGTFKARGAAVGVAMARSFGAGGIALPTAGNAGAAWAFYASLAGLPCAVWAAEDAPAHAIDGAREHGADVTVVDGDIGVAGAAAREFARDRGWHFAGTFREPWRVEGKKTAFFEIARALGWRMPDAAVLPVGGGVGAVAWHKAANELREAGWATGSTRIYAIQSEGCAPIVRAFGRGAHEVEAWPDPRTRAAGIRIPSPLAGALVLKALRESGGGAVAISDDAIEPARRHLSEAGVAALDESAAAWAGYETLKNQGVFARDEVVVVYSTGSVV